MLHQDHCNLKTQKFPNQILKYHSQPTSSPFFNLDEETRLELEKTRTLKKPRWYHRLDDDSVETGATAETDIIFYTRSKQQGHQVCFLLSILFASISSPCILLFHKIFSISKTKSTDYRKGRQRIVHKKKIASVRVWSWVNLCEVFLMICEWGRNHVVSTSCISRLYMLV